MVAFLASPAVLAGLMVSIAGWGLLVAPRLDWPGRYGAGALAVYALTAALGWTGLLRPATLWAVAGLGLAAGLWNIRRSLPGQWKVALAAAVLLLPLAALPPVSRDAMNHHLLLPSMWLEEGAMFRPSWAHFFSYPYLVETIYALTGGTVGLRMGRLVSLSGLLAAAVCAAKVAGGGRRGAMAVLVLLSIPELLRNGSWAFSDTYLVLFSLLVLRELVLSDGERWRALLWASAAGCCKYNGLLLVPLVIAAAALRGRRWSRREVLLSLLAVVVPAAGWALPNLLQWGNPLYPRLGWLLGGVERSARAAGLMADYGSYTAALRGVGDVLLLPLRISVGGEWDNPRLFDGSSGPLLLAGALLSIWGGRRRKTAILLPLAYLVAAQAVLGSTVRVRYLLPGLAMLSVTAGAGLWGLLRRGRTAALLTWCLVAICAGWSALWLGRLYGAERPWEYAGDGEYLERRLPYWEFYRRCEGALDDGDLTLLVNMGNRAYYFPGDVRFDPERFPLTLMDLFWKGLTAGEAAERLRAMGITHIALNMNYTVDNLFVELEPAQARECSRMLTLRARPLVTRAPYCLLRLEDPPSSQVRCEGPPEYAPAEFSRR
jgi:hypothetical protein